MRNFGADVGATIARYRAGGAVAPTVLPSLTATVVDTKPTAVTPAPTICIGCGDNSEMIPLSDPRHPQHAVWLAMQQHSNQGWYSRFGEFMAGTFGPWAPVVEIGGAVLLAGAGWYFLRRPKQGVAP